jgi:hypothetical protein
MSHLTSDELIDAVEGVLAAERQAHLAACDACRRELTDLSGVLSEAKQVSMPEPSPLFWNHFSERVRVAIDANADTAGTWPHWLRWQLLAPLGAVAFVILALLLAVPKQDASRVEAERIAVSASDALDAPDAPDSWVALASLVGDLDVEVASAAGVMVKPGVAEQAVLELTAEEQQELTRLLKAELMRAKS